MSAPSLRKNRLRGLVKNRSTISVLVSLRSLPLSGRQGGYGGVAKNQWKPAHWRACCAGLDRSSILEVSVVVFCLLLISSPTKKPLVNKRKQ